MKVFKNELEKNLKEISIASTFTPAGNVGVLVKDEYNSIHIMLSNQEIEKMHQHLSRLLGKLF